MAPRELGLVWKVGAITKHLRAVVGQTGDEACRNLRPAPMNARARRASAFVSTAQDGPGLVGRNRIVFEFVERPKRSGLVSPIRRLLL